MNAENFDKAPAEKQQSVLNAGFICFAKNGYKKTAMSEIAVMAGVSKPLLFHYFGTKLNFYFYLLRYSYGLIGSKITTGSDDYFDCISIATEIKLNVMKQYAGMYEFLVSATRESGEIRAKILREVNADALSKATATLYANVNWSKLKNGVSQQDAMNIVDWIREGYIRENSTKDKDTVITEINRYFALIKGAIYREEYL